MTRDRDFVSYYWTVLYHSRTVFVTRDRGGEEGGGKAEDGMVGWDQRWEVAHRRQPGRAWIGSLGLVSSPNWAERPASN